MKIKTILVIAAMCFAIIPMIIYVTCANILSSKNGDAEFNRQISELVQNQVYTINAYLDTVHAQTAAIANMAEIKEAAKGKANNAAGNILVTLAETNKDINSAVLVDSKGGLILGRAPTNSQIDFEKLIKCEDDVLYAVDTSTKLMFVKTKVGSSSLVVFYNVAADTFLCKVPANSTFYTEGSIRVIVPALNSEYILINASDPGGSFSRFSEDVQTRIAQLGEGQLSEPILYDVKENNFTEKNMEIIQRVGGANDPVIIASCAVKYAGVYANKAVSTVIVALVILAILAIAGAVTTSIMVTRPLATIEETLIKIHRGDHEARITTVSNNEYGQISRAFNNLVDEIVVSEDRYRTIIEMSDNIIFEWNFKSNEVFFSNNFNKKFSYRAPSDHFADSFLLKAKLHSDDSERYKEDLEKLGNGEEFKGNEYRMKNIYGDFIWVLMRTATLRDKEGNPSKIVGVIVDIDRAKKSEQQLTARASYDSLTSLYNRETVESQINNEIALSEARKSEMAVLFVDVDDFKHYNDQYSHATGDQVLKFVARTVNSVVGEYGFAGRYGGDEFIACIRNAELNDPARAAQEIIARLNEGFNCDGAEHLKISVSIGIAVIKDDYNTQVEFLIGKADDAMYSVKKSGKSNYAFI
ncbi:MAG: diguanylate cyclase [Oscillospiraceae bacterium]